jgi:V8-like Glu-specific endopeptidase
MKSFLVVSSLIFMKMASASPTVVYGIDNRVDVYQNKNALAAQLAHSTAGMISILRFSKGTNDLLLDLKPGRTVGKMLNLCSTEAFQDQQSGPTCSGFLAGPDILVTAGHCYKSGGSADQVCNTSAWVFDFQMNSSTSDPTKNIDKRNIYLCKEVIQSELSKDHDFTIIRLNRPVTDRKPLAFRTSGKISDKSKLMVIGHPVSLPLKIADGGTVMKNNQKTKFSATLDTFSGNSGSPVFDSQTGMVEGILIQGKTDYVPSIPEDEESCKVLNICDEKGKNCSGTEDDGPVNDGEVVYRISSIAKKIKAALEGEEE